VVGLRLFNPLYEHLICGRFSIVLHMARYKFYFTCLYLPFTLSSIIHFAQWTGVQTDQLKNNLFGLSSQWKVQNLQGRCWYCYFPSFCLFSLLQPTKPPPLLSNICVF